MAKEAFLIIDMLNDFVNKGAPLEVPAARKIVPRIKVFLEKAREKSDPIIFVCDSHLPDDKEFEAWPKHAIAGTSGAGVIPELKYALGLADTYIIFKTRYSGFYGTGLHRLLLSLGVKKLFITGILTNVCVLCTAVDAVMRDYEVTVPSDAVASLSESDCSVALQQMWKVFGIKVPQVP